MPCREIVDLRQATFRQCDGKVKESPSAASAQPRLIIRRVRQVCAPRDTTSSTCSTSWSEHRTRRPILDIMYMSIDPSGYVTYCDPGRVHSRSACRHRTLRLNGPETLADHSAMPPAPTATAVGAAGLATGLLTGGVRGGKVGGVGMAVPGGPAVVVPVAPARFSLPSADEEQGPSWRAVQLGDGVGVSSPHAMH